METLAKLFGGEIKVKLLRLFVFNESLVLETNLIAERVKAPVSKVRRELTNLEKLGLIKAKSIKGKKAFMLQEGFPHLLGLRTFLLTIEPLTPKEIARKITRLGNIKLILIAGLFIQEFEESRVDLLVVGDNVKKGSLEGTIKTIEADIGKEVRYAYFTTDDFRYRLSMCDKLTRDILDYPHRMVLNKLGNL